MIVNMMFHLQEITSPILINCNYSAKFCKKTLDILFSKKLKNIRVSLISSNFYLRGAEKLKDYDIKQLIRGA